MLLNPRPAVPGSTTTRDPATSLGHRLDVTVAITSDITDAARLAPLITQLWYALYHHRWLPDEGPRPDRLRYTFDVVTIKPDAMTHQLTVSVVTVSTRDRTRPSKLLSTPRRPLARRRTIPRRKTPLLTGEDGSLEFTATPADTDVAALRDALLAYYGLSTPRADPRR